MEDFDGDSHVDNFSFVQCHRKEGSNRILAFDKRGFDLTIYCWSDRARVFSLSVRLFRFLSPFFFSCLSNKTSIVSVRFPAERKRGSRLPWLLQFSIAVSGKQTEERQWDIHMHTLTNHLSTPLCFFFYNHRAWNRPSCNESKSTREKIEETSNAKSICWHWQTFDFMEILLQLFSSWTVDRYWSKTVHTFHSNRTYQ